MQVLIYKTELKGLASARHWPRDLAPGDPVGLRLDAERIIGVYATHKPRLWMRKPRQIRLGELNEQDTTLLDLAVRSGAHLRVRIVEIHPANLTSNGQPRVAISVWGDPKDLSTQGPRHTAVL